MIRGLYNGAAALDMLAQRQEMISSNLANVNSSGHRMARMAVSQRDDQPSDGFINDLGPKVDQIALDFNAGRLHKTDRPLDVSIVGNGFFEFDSPDGALYTRGGQFYRDAATDELINSEGLRVQDANGGPISIPANIGDREITIADDGTITANGRTLGQLSVVSFNDNKTLDSLNDNHSWFRAGPNSQITDKPTNVLQGHQEYSNGNAVSEMVSMIIGTRQYEAVQRVTKTISESLKEHIRA